MSRSICRACSSSRPPTFWTPFLPLCAIAWKSSNCRATPKKKRSRSHDNIWFRAGATTAVLKPDQIEFEDDALGIIVRHYTRETGVRNLEREITSICRKQARRILEGKDPGLLIVNGGCRGISRFAEIPAGRRSRRARETCRRGDRTCLDSGRRRHPVRRSEYRERWPASDRDGAGRRRHAGIDEGRADLGSFRTRSNSGSIPIFTRTPMFISTFLPALFRRMVLRPA